MASNTGNSGAVNVQDINWTRYLYEAEVMVLGTDIIIEEHANPTNPVCKYWIVAEVEGTLRPLAAVQATITPNVTPAQIVGHLYKIISMAGLQVIVRDQLARAAQYHTDGTIHTAKFPTLMACIVAAIFSANDTNVAVPRSQIIDSIQLLHPVAGFGPEANNVSFAVVDITDPENLKGCFAFPFGIPSQWESHTGMPQQSINNHSDAHIALDCNKYLQVFNGYFNPAFVPQRPGLPAYEPIWTGYCYYNYDGVDTMQLYRIWPRQDGTWQLPCHPADWSRNRASIGPCPCGCDQAEYQDNEDVDMLY